jgi:hypothetical protein
LTGSAHKRAYNSKVTAEGLLKLGQSVLKLIARTAQFQRNTSFLRAANPDQSGLAAGA